MGRNQQNDPESNKFKWDNIRVGLARAVSFTRSRDLARGISGTTLKSSIAEAIVDIDASTGDPVETLGDEETYVADDSLTGTGVRKGKLQKVEDLITLYFGDGEALGLFAEYKNLGDVEVE